MKSSSSYFVELLIVGIQSHNETGREKITHYNWETVAGAYVALLFVCHPYTVECKTAIIYAKVMV